MKLLFLADLQCEGLINGGVKTAVFNLFEGLSRYSDKYDIYFVTINRNHNEQKYFSKNGINIYSYKSTQNILLRPRFLFDAFNIRRLIRKIKPDAINIVDNPAMAFAGLGISCPQVYTIHGIKEIESKLWKGKEYWSHKAESMIEKMILRKYKNFISISPYVNNILKEKNIKKDRIFNIPNALSLKFLKINAKNTKCDNDFSIINIGSFTQLKSQHILLDTLAELNNILDFKCTLCGSSDDPDYFNYLKTYKSRIKNLVILNSQTPDEIINLMKESSLLVHTAKQENTPMVFLEAFSMKLPVISSRVGGVNYILNNDRYGTSYEYGNVRQLKNIILDFNKNKDMYREKANKAYEYVKANHSPNIIAGKTIEVMKNLISK